MKTLIRNHGSVSAIFFAVLTIFCGQNLAYGIDVADRTPQVRDAIVVAAGVNTPDEVTEAHLSAITLLSLGLSNITALQAGDFEGLTALRMLLLNNNTLTDLPGGVFEGLTSLQVLLLNNNQLTALPETVFNNLTSLQVLLLNNNALTALPETVFSDLFSLQMLLLNNNQLADLPNGVFTGLIALQHLDLSNNVVAPVALPVSLERVADAQFKAVVPTGSPFDIVLPISITNGSISSGETALTIPQGSVESEIFTVDRTPGTLAAVTVYLGALPGLPEKHNGYAVVASGDLPLELIASEGINPLSDRTPQVSAAIVAAAGVDTPDEVTEAHLSAITSLNLSFNDITSLNVSDFDGLTSLEYLYLNNNALTALPETVFRGLTSLQVLLLNNNALTALPETVFNGLPSLRALLLLNNQLPDLPETVFNGLSSLQYLYLDSNQLTALPETVFSGLTALQYLYLSNNAVDPIALTVSLERVDNGQFKAVAPIGAPFDIRLPIHITDGSIIGGATAVTIPQGSTESAIFTVIPTSGTNAAVTADIGTLPELPAGHSGYTLVKSTDLPLVLMGTPGINLLSDRTPQVRDAIVAAAGVSTPAEVTEAHLAAITSLGLAHRNITSLKAGDFDGLTSLEVLLLNNNRLTVLPETVFNELTSLRVLLLNSNRLTVLPETVLNELTSLEVLLLNNNRLTVLPETVFGELTSLRYLYLDNNGVAPLEMVVSLERVADGEFKATTSTPAPFDMLIPISITNSSSVIGGATSLTIPQGSVESESLTVTRTPGTKAAVTADIGTLPELPAGHRGYTLVKSTDLPLVLIGGINAAPVFSDGDSTTRSIAENTASGTDIGSAVTATDADEDTLTYSLGGTDASSFSIVSTSGQLQTSAALDYETTTSYSVTITVSDGNGASDSISVTINVTDANDAPVFSDGASTTRAVAENTASGTNIGSAVSATDQDGNTLTYSLGGADASSFSIVSTSGQLQTSAALDRETDASYTVTVSVSDGNGGSNSIAVTINVTNVNEGLAFDEGDSTTRAVAENTASGISIGEAVSATDTDGDTLTYTLGGTDAASFSIVSTSGQLQTSAALDYETKNSYSVTVSASDGNGESDSILRHKHRHCGGSNRSGCASEYADL